MKIFKNFVSLTRDELRNTLGGAATCISSCSSDGQCKSNNPNGYCSSVPCQPKPGGGYVTKKVCALNDNQNP